MGLAGVLPGFFVRVRVCIHASAPARAREKSWAALRAAPLQRAAMLHADAQRSTAPTVVATKRG
jgi:hypothetical protein